VGWRVADAGRFQNFASGWQPNEARENATGSIGGESGAQFADNGIDITGEHLFMLS